MSLAVSFPGRAFVAILLLAIVPASAGAFTIKGRVVNGTTQDRNVTTDVIIVDPAGGMAGEQTVRAENGVFEAAGLSDDTSVFLVRIDHQGVMYNEMVRTSEGDPAEIVVMIYESTEAWEGVRVAMPHMVARRHGDHMEMEQLYEVNNVSNPPRTVIGEGPFHFPIPEDKQEIEGVYVTALGMPIERPDGGQFGTVCFIDSKQNAHNDMHIRLVEQIKRMIELSLRIVLAKEEIDRRDRLLDDLSRIYPICSYCKKVREETGRWVSVEKYVSDISGAMPSHGVCPQCYERELKRFS